jgi:hypothetical protein
MSDIDQLFSQIPIGDLAAKLKLQDDVARKAVATGLPSLVHGLAANVKDSAGANSLFQALLTKDPSLIAGGIDVAAIDVKDGKKIVKNIYGKSAPKVAARLGDAAGISGSTMKKVLPILAPIILAFLAQKVLGGSKKTTTKSGGDLGDILGGMLGGGSSSGGGLGDILGGILGGGKGSTGGLGDILGGLLGGGKR